MQPIPSELANYAGTGKVILEELQTITARSSLRNFALSECDNQ